MVKDMTSGSPMRLIFSFALPLLMGNLLQQTYSLVDAALVGQFLGMNALAGVGASSSVLFLILGFCNGLTGGFGIPVAQSVGAKRDDHVRDYVRHSYLLGGMISVPGNRSMMWWKRTKTEMSISIAARFIWIPTVS